MICQLTLRRTTSTDRSVSSFFSEFAWVAKWFVRRFIRECVVRDKIKKWRQRDESIEARWDGSPIRSVACNFARRNRNDRFVSSRDETRLGSLLILDIRQRKYGAAARSIREQMKRQVVTTPATFTLRDAKLQEMDDRWQAFKWHRFKRSIADGSLRRSEGEANYSLDGLFPTRPWMQTWNVIATAHKPRYTNKNQSFFCARRSE